MILSPKLRCFTLIQDIIRYPMAISVSFKTWVITAALQTQQGSICGAFSLLNTAVCIGWKQTSCVGLFGCLTKGKIINIRLHSLEQIYFLSLSYAWPQCLHLLSGFRKLRQCGVRVAEWEEVSGIMKSVNLRPNSWKHKPEDSPLAVNILNSFFRWFCTIIAISNINVTKALEHILFS